MFGVVLVELNGSEGLFYLEEQGFVLGVWSKFGKVFCIELLISLNPSCCRILSQLWIYLVQGCSGFRLLISQMAWRLLPWWSNKNSLLNNGDVEYQEIPLIHII